MSDCWSSSRLCLDLTHLPFTPSLRSRTQSRAPRYLSLSGTVSPSFSVREKKKQHFSWPWSLEAFWPGTLQNAPMSGFVPRVLWLDWGYGLLEGAPLTWSALLCLIVSGVCDIHVTWALVTWLVLSWLVSRLQGSCFSISLLCFWKWIPKHSPPWRSSGKSELQLLGAEISTCIICRVAGHPDDFDC